MPTNCIFCKIISRELPAKIIYEDENTISFLDINPINSGHSLVLPKKHVGFITKLTDLEFQHLSKVARSILIAIESSQLKCEGANLFINDGPIAGQEVFHTHLHIIPRFENDGHRLDFINPTSSTTKEKNGLDTPQLIVDEIKKSLNLDL